MAVLKRSQIQALTRPARRVWKLLPEISLWKDFYLAGGTALALQLGHRVSLDFDFFSEKNPLESTQRSKLLALFSQKGALEVLEEKDRTLQFSFEGVALSFFHYPIPLLHAPLYIEKVRLASPVDIGLMKLGAVIGRGSKKDFVDLYVLAKSGVSLGKLFQGAPKKYPSVRDFTTQALRALVYFEDADHEPMPKMLKPIVWPEVKQFFQTEVLKLARQDFGRF